MSGVRKYTKYGHSMTWVQYARASKYDVRPEEYDRMLIEQDNRCKLCRQPFGTDRATAPCVEHKHVCANQVSHKRHVHAKRYRKWAVTNRSEWGCAECVRGLVCRQCNQVVVRFLELYPNRATVAEQAYIADRPILRYRAEYHLSGHDARSAFQMGT